MSALAITPSTGAHAVRVPVYAYEWLADVLYSLVAVEHVLMKVIVGAGCAGPLRRRAAEQQEQRCG